jgi:hypothetical protein
MESWALFPAIAAIIFGVNHAFSRLLKLKQLVFEESRVSITENGTPMPISHGSMDHCPHPSARRADVEEPRPSRTRRTTRRVLSFLVVWFAAVVVGCGDDKSSPEVKEDLKQKQQVVQEKMKEYMQQKLKAKGPRR